MNRFGDGHGQGHSRHGYESRRAGMAPKGGRDAGFTLLEALLSSFIVAIIMGAMVSTMVIAQRGLAAGAKAGSVTSQGNAAMQMITLDISLATAITERTDKAITVVVPDRDNGGQNETIRYAWSGVLGDPLTRQYNGGAVTVILDKVYRLNFTYLFKTLTACVNSWQGWEPVLASLLGAAGEGEPC